MHSPTPVCVTAVGGGSFGEQILKALRLASTAYTIVGANMDVGSVPLDSVDVAVALPAARDTGYMHAVLTVCRTYGIRALFGGSEAELLVLSEHRALLEAEGVFFPAAPHDLLTLCLDKSRLFSRLEQEGMQTLWYRCVRHSTDLGDDPPYPLVLKPSRGGGGSADVCIAQNAAEADMFCTYLLRSYGEIIVQEYVGTPENEYTVGVLTDMDGHLIQSIALRRNLSSTLSRRLRVPNRTGREEFGPTLVISSGISQGRIGPYPDICRQCVDMARILGARGPFNLQGRVVRGEFLLFEINPRFSGTTSMRAMVGMNEPDLLVRHHVLGEEIPRGSVLEERTIVRRLEELILP